MYKILINQNLCKQCGICIEFCPKNVFLQNEDGTILPKNVKNCIGCKMCEMRCPDFAILMEVTENEK